MNGLLDATQPCFGAISQIRHLDPLSVQSPEALQARLCGFVDEMRSRLGQAGLGGQDVEDIAYAVVALADEVALNAGEALGSYWMMNLLQFKYFRENTAGDGFFTRLDEIRRNPRRKDALRAYTLCLLFGFQGKYRVRGGELELLTLIESLQREALHAGGGGEALSVHGQRPVEALGGAKRNLPLLVAVVGAVVAAVLLYSVLRIVLGHNMSSLEGEIVAIPHP
jgi:type VI secretion system protein ImpK